MLQTFGYVCRHWFLPSGELYPATFCLMPYVTPHGIGNKTHEITLVSVGRADTVIPGDAWAFSVVGICHDWNLSSPLSCLTHAFILT